MLFLLANAGGIHLNYHTAQRKSHLWKCSHTNYYNMGNTIYHNQKYL